MKTRIISAALLLISASITSAFAGSVPTPESAPATWVGNSAVRINTNTWYYCGAYLDWCTGQFNDADLGELTVLTLGGQSQVYNGGHNWQFGCSMDMYYKIDNEEPATIQLKFAGETRGNNMLLETSNGNEAEINLAPYRDGQYHTLTVWFKSGTVYDNNTYEGVTYNYVANFKAVEPTANWVGKSAINVNSKWYYAGVELYWGGGEGNYPFFHGQNLGPIKTLTLGGQSQIYDDGLDWKEGEMNMYYRFDDGQESSIILSYYSFNNNNMYFQSGGSTFVDTPIDISGLSNGEHTLSIWFERNGVYDSNNSQNYVATFTKIDDLTISDDIDATDATQILNQYSNKYVDFVIQGRTIYAGTWNTLCLPFWLEDLRGTILEGADLRKFKGATFEEGTGTLELNFEKQIVGMETQIPYLVKLPEGATNIVNPEFKNVQIMASNPKYYSFSSNPEAVALFHGCFGSFTFSGNQYLYLGEGNTLYWPDPSITIGAFRGYFELAPGITAGEPENSNIKSFVLNFDEETTSIKQVNNAAANASAWYTLDGRRLNEKPATAGLYINNGKKVVIK